MPLAPKRNQNGLRRGDPQLIAEALGLSISMVYQVIYGKKYNAVIQELVDLAKSDYTMFVNRLAHEKDLTTLKQQITS